MKSGKRNILLPPSLLMFERCDVHDVPLKHGILLPDYIIFRPINVQCDIDCHGDFISNGTSRFPLHCNELNPNDSYFFFFFFLGAICISSGSTSAFKAYCAYPKFLTAQIHYSCVSYKETEVPK
jgi:hypothetical protein